MSICKLNVLLSSCFVFLMLVWGGWLLLGNHGSEWISSYIEISIALNCAIGIPRVRRVLSKSLLKFCSKIVSSTLKCPLENCSEEGASFFAEITTRMIKRFVHRLERILKFASIAGPVFAFVGIVVLLTECAKKYQWLLVPLIAPFLIAYIGSYVCYLCVRDHFLELSMDVGGLKAVDKQAEDNTISGLEKLIKERRSKTMQSGVVTEKD